MKNIEGNFCDFLAESNNYTKCFGTTDADCGADAPGWLQKVINKPMGVLANVYNSLNSGCHISGIAGTSPWNTNNNIGSVISDPDI